VSYASPGSNGTIFACIFSRVGFTSENIATCLTGFDYDTDRTERH